MSSHSEVLVSHRIGLSVGLQSIISEDAHILLKDIVADVEKFLRGSNAIIFVHTLNIDSKELRHLIIAQINGQIALYHAFNPIFKLKNIIDIILTNNSLKFICEYL
jgi:hypothetical protein